MCIHTHINSGFLLHHDKLDHQVLPNAPFVSATNTRVIVLKVAYKYLWLVLLCLWHIKKLVGPVYGYIKR